MFTSPPYARPCAFLFAMLHLSAPLLSAEPPGEKHIYKQVDDRHLAIYVTKPEHWTPQDSRPAVVFFHGGGWTGGAPGQFSEHAQYLASRGMVCFQVQYRLLDKSDQQPPVTCTQDAKSAMRWVRQRCAEFGIDPQRIASAGGSAGGHLAAFVGTVDGGDAPQDDLTISAKSNAMLLFNPVYDNGPGGWGTTRVGERFAEFSPLHNLTPDDPPSIVFLGTEDKLIPVATAEKFRDISLGQGVLSELHTYSGQPHGFFNVSQDNGRWYIETLTATDRFLAKLGWLQGEPKPIKTP
jgi:acetyl esterase/lipase